ncbi:MAG: sulfatase [Tepidisphaeraceae bacterium]
MKPRVLLIALIAITSSTFAADAPLRKRNVLFITADDYNVSMGAYGNAIVQTPHLDRLAARGVRFERAYCQNPLCNPSRASFMTGLRPNTTTLQTNGPRLRERKPDVVTLPQLFKDNGYLAARVGKIYHQGIPGGVGKQTHDDALSWDITVDPPGAEFATTGEEFNPTPKRGQGFRHVIGTSDGAEQHDHQAATEAIRLLEKNKDKPLFLAVGFIRPHVPPIAPKKQFDLYPLEKIRLPQVPQDRDDIPVAAFHDPLVYWNMTEQQSRESIRAYYASVSFMDEQVGRLLDALDRLKLTDDTLIVFLGDHGYLLGEHQTWQKMTLFEEAARVPLLVAGAGVKGKGTAPRGLAELIDVCPTVAELCGLTAPAAVEGVSLKPLLDDASAPGKPAVFTQLQRKAVDGRSVRTDRWRYTEWNGGLAGVELYDHDADPREHVNLAKHPKHADTIAELKRVLDRTLPTTRPAAQP